MTHTIEELSLNAWPAPRQVLLDGWLVRLGSGYTRRANSVSVLTRGRMPIERKIAECERIYFGESRPCVFRLTRAAGEELESELSARGYARDGAVSVRTLELAGRQFTPEARVVLAADYDPAWGEAYAAMNGIGAVHRPAMEAILRAIVPTRQFALISDSSGPLSAGLAVLERDHVGLFDIVTRPDQRRNGHATCVIHALLAWAMRQQAIRAYLQVTTTNTAALPLYARLGFVEAYQYWYRVKKP